MMHSNQHNITSAREAILADACKKFAEELRDIEPAHYYVFFNFGDMPDVYDQVSALLDRHFAQGTFNFACTGEADIAWNEVPSAAIDLEFFSQGIFVYFRLFMAGNQSRVEIHHIIFHESAGNPTENTTSLKQTLKAAILAPETQSGGGL